MNRQLRVLRVAFVLLLGSSTCDARMWSLFRKKAPEQNGKPQLGSQPTIAVVSLMPYHYEVLFGYAEELSLLGHRVAVYARFLSSDNSVAQMKSAANVLQHHIHVSEVQNAKGCKPLPADRIVFITSQEEMMVHYHEFANFLKELKPKRVYAVIHDAQVKVPFGTLALASARSIVTFLTMSPLTRDTFAAWFKKQRLSPFHHNWVLPIHWYQPQQECVQFRAACKRQFVVQGNVDSTRRNYQGIMMEMMRTSGVPGNLQLLFLGKGHVDVPEVLKGKVRQEMLLDYQAYFQEIHQSLALVPAFLGQAYTNGSKISSTVVVSLICGTPIIADAQLLAAYPFISPASVFLRGPRETEVQAMVRVLELPVQKLQEVRTSLLQDREKLRQRDLKVLEEVLQLD